LIDLDFSAVLLSRAVACGLKNKRFSNKQNRGEEEIHQRSRNWAAAKCGQQQHAAAREKGRPISHALVSIFAVWCES